ncbi:hypothetical protein AAG570_006939 [Ranatra chinensis]|uniref:Uncharacterized protein n=1 Tax=Ranatra chinensis TaxID=642074 RepID=A0ABD0Z614_9HEMI
MRKRVEGHLICGWTHPGAPKLDSLQSCSTGGKPLAAFSISAPTTSGRVDHLEPQSGSGPPEQATDQPTTQPIASVTYVHRSRAIKRIGVDRTKESARRSLFPAKSCVDTWNTRTCLRVLAIRCCVASERPAPEHNPNLHSLTPRMIGDAIPSR